MTNIYGYDDWINMNEDTSNPSTIPDVKYGAATISNARQNVAEKIASTGKKLGWTNNAIACMVAEVGRENGWNIDTILKGHSDAVNNKLNVGIISWQGDRKTSLLKYLKSKGTYDGKHITNSLITIGHMVEFFYEEMASRGGDTSVMTSGGKTTKQISDELWKSIKYSTSEKYNPYDKYFKSTKTHEWAQRARELGIVSYS